MYAYATSTVMTKVTISTKPKTPSLLKVTAQGYKKMISMSNTMNNIAVR